MSAERQIRRRMLRKKVGGKNMQEAWRDFQILKYGKDLYQAIRFTCQMKKHRKEHPWGSF